MLEKSKRRSEKKITRYLDTCSHRRQLLSQKQQNSEVFVHLTGKEGGRKEETLLCLKLGVRTSARITHESPFFSQWLGSIWAASFFLCFLRNFLFSRVFPLISISRWNAHIFPFFPSHPCVLGGERAILSSICRSTSIGDRLWHWHIGTYKIAWSARVGPKPGECYFYSARYDILFVTSLWRWVVEILVRNSSGFLSGGECSRSVRAVITLVVSLEVSSVF